MSQQHLHIHNHHNNAYQNSHILEFLHNITAVRSIYTFKPEHPGPQKWAPEWAPGQKIGGQHPPFLINFVGSVLGPILDPFWAIFGLG